MSNNNGVVVKSQVEIPINKRKTSFEKVNISDLKISEGIKFRPIKNKVIDEYVSLMRDGVKFQPIDAVKDLEGNFWVYDYQHRTEATKKIGEKKIRVRWRDGTEKEAKLLHAASNKHGLGRTNKEKINAVEDVLADYLDWSDSAIASWVGVSKSFVGVRRQLFSKNYRTTTPRKGKDGKIYSGKSNNPNGRPSKNKGKAEKVTSNTIVTKSNSDPTQKSSELEKELEQTKKNLFEQQKRVGELESEIEQLVQEKHEQFKAQFDEEKEEIHTFAKTFDDEEYEAWEEYKSKVDKAIDYFGSGKIKKYLLDNQEGTHRYYILLEELF